MGTRPIRTRLRVTLVAAIAAHGAAFEALRPLAAAGVASRPARPPAADTVDVETVLGLPAEPPAAPLERPRDGAPSRASDVPARGSSRSAATARDAPAPTEGTQLDLAPPAAPGEATWSLRVTNADRAKDIGLDPRGRASVAGRAAAARAGEETSPALDARSTTGGLAEGLDAHDTSMGLGRGGLVRSTVEDAVQASNVMGSATFEVRIELGGKVTVRVEDASEGTVSWSALSDAIRQGVVSKRAGLRMPPGARGLRVVVRAEAKDLLPDGRSPARLGSRVEATAGGIKETRERIDIKLPSATFIHEGKVCAAGLHVGFDGVGILGGCSPENAGRSPTRIVAARIVSESRL